MQEENRDQMIKMPVEIFPECPYPADVHYVDLPEVYKARVQRTQGSTHENRLIARTGWIFPNFSQKNQSIAC